MDRLNEQGAKFEATFLPHLDAAYNLARWLTHNDQDAQDVVQEAYLRALRGFDSFRGGDQRSWILTIVRNTAFTWRRQSKGHAAAGHDPDADDSPEPAADESTYDPAVRALRAADVASVRKAIAALPDGLREVVVLREMEGMSYKEIAAIAAVPIGTVMSRLARARGRLHELLTAPAQE